MPDTIVLDDTPWYLRAASNLADVKVEDLSEDLKGFLEELHRMTYLANCGLQVPDIAVAMVTWRRISGQEHYAETNKEK